MFLASDRSALIQGPLQRDKPETGRQCFGSVSFSPGGNEHIHRRSCGSTNSLSIGAGANSIRQSGRHKTVSNDEPQSVEPISGWTARREQDSRSATGSAGWIRGGIRIRYAASGTTGDRNTSHPRTDWTTVKAKPGNIGQERIAGEMSHFKKS